MLLICIQDTGFTVPALFRVLDLRHRIIPTVKNKDVRIAYLGTGTTAGTLCGVKNRGHETLLGSAMKAICRMPFHFNLCAKNILFKNQLFIILLISTI